jgi:hypothetical protein
MKTNLKSFTLGASLALGLLGVYALAVSIPNVFSSGEVISAAKMNANFEALKTTVDALETKTAALQAAKSLPARDGYNAYALIPSSGVIDEIYSFNPGGGISLTSSTAGNYIVTFLGNHLAIRTVQVTPYGNTTNTCRVNEWRTNFVSVTCFTTAGVAANTDFIINVAN